MEEQSKKGLGRALQIIALSFVVIIAPGLSWYYLSSGVAYRKAVLSELKDYGTVNYLDWQVLNRPKFPVADSLKGKIVVVGIVDQNSSQAELATSVMNKVFEQFKDRSDVLFATFLTNTDSTTALAYAKKNNPKSYTNYWFSTISAKEYPKLLDGLKLNQKGVTAAKECSYITYINAQSTVSNFYDIRDNNQLGRLIEHIAMRLKIDKFETPEIIRDKEK